MIADIAHGHVDFADVMFLIAMILAVLAAVAHYGATTAKHAFPLLALAIASIAFGWVLL